MKVRLTLALGSIAALLVTQPAAGATLRFSVPADCDPRADVIEDVERLIGRPLDQVDAEFDVVITPGKGGGYELLLTSAEPAESATGARRLTGATCAEIGNAAAVTIAMAIRLDQQPVAPTASAAAKEEAVAPSAPAPPPKSAAVRAASGARAAPAPKPTPIFGFLGLSAVADLGALPALAPGVELAAGVGWPGARLSAFGAVFAPERATLAGGQGGEFQLVLAGVLGCLERGRGLALRGCLGFELGQLTGEGTGVAAPHLGATLWAAPRAQIGGVWGLGEGLALSFALGAQLPLSRREFVLDRGERVHRAAALDLRAQLGVEFRP